MSSSDPATIQVLLKQCQDSTSKVSDLPTRIELMAATAELLHQNGDDPAARSLLKEASTAALRLPTREQQSWSLLLVARAYAMVGDVAPARDALKIIQPDESRLRAGEETIFNASPENAYRLGILEDSLKPAAIERLLYTGNFKKAFELLESIKDPKQRSLSLQQVALVAAKGGNLDQVVLALEKLPPEALQPPANDILFIIQGQAHAHQDNLAMALAFYRKIRSFEVADQARSQIVPGLALKGYFKVALSEAKRIRNKDTRERAYGDLARIATNGEHQDQVDRLLRSISDLSLQAEVRIEVAEKFLEAGLLSKAQDQFTKAVATAQSWRQPEPQRKELEARITRTYAVMLASKSLFEEARSSLTSLPKEELIDGMLSVSEECLRRGHDEEAANTLAYVQFELKRLAADKSSQPAPELCLRLASALAACGKVKDSLTVLLDAPEDSRLSGALSVATDFSRLGDHPSALKTLSWFDRPAEKLRVRLEIIRGLLEYQKLLQSEAGEDQDTSL